MENLDKFNTILKKKYVFIFLFFLILLVYSNSFKNPICGDGWNLILNNPYIRDWFYFPKLFTGEYFYYFGDISYRPVTSFSYFIDYSISKYNPAGWHALTLLTHYLCVILIFLIVEKVSKNTLIAFFTSAVFAIHPVHNEIINEVSSREDIQVLAFILLSFYLYIIYNEKKESKVSQSQNNENIDIKNDRFNKLILNGYFILSLISYFFALFTKESALVFPAILFLYDYLIKGNKILYILKEKTEQYVLYFVLIFFYFYITSSVIVSPVLSASKFGRSAAYPGGNILTAVATTIEVLFFYYLPKLIWPVSMCPGIGYPVTDFSIKFFISLLLLMILIIWIVRIRKKEPVIFFYISYFFINLLPVSNIIPIGLTSSERYLYIPSFGFFVVIFHYLFRYSYFIRNIFEKFVNNIKVLNKFKNILDPLFILFLIITILFSLNTYKRNFKWSDPKIICEECLKYHPDDMMSYVILGHYYSNKQDFDFAINFFEKAQEILKKQIREKKYIDISSYDWFTQNIYWIGYTYWKKGEEDIAIKKFNVFVKIASKRIKVKNYLPYYYLGDYYLRKNDIETSLKYFLYGLKIYDKCSYTNQNIGMIYLLKKRIDIAVYHLLKAIESNKRNYHAYNNLGVVLYLKNDYKNARQYFLKAYSLNKNEPDIIYNLALVENILGNKKTALDLVEKYVNLIGYKKFIFLYYPEMKEKLEKGEDININTDLNKILTVPKGIFASASFIKP